MLVLRSAKYPWVSAQEASHHLGFSEKSLECWKDCGYLKAGKHWKSKPGDTNNMTLYNLQLCKEEMHEWWGRDALAGP